MRSWKNRAGSGVEEGEWMMMMMMVIGGDDEEIIMMQMEDKYFDNCLWK